MDYENLGGYSLRSLSRKNVILGKNGCGKSYLLKTIDGHLRQKEGVGRVRYISPERAGLLQYEPNVDSNISQNATWMDDTRRRNQAQQFKQQSAVLFRRLEMLFLRELQEDHTKDGYVPRHFNDILGKINGLLDRVMIRTARNDLEIVEKESGAPATPETISSGEAELISLAIEFLSFFKECDPDKQNFLLIDEPDVHLHPDLQDRLANFISEELKSDKLTIILATHSTSLLSSLGRSEEAKVVFLRSGDRVLKFRAISDVLKRVLPMFGAHPLSNIFNEAPILLLEGEDDERIWQSAVRSSHGKIEVYPCAADSIDRLKLFEREANEIIQSVYDEALGYSLRDRDDKPEEIDNVGEIERMRLSCRTAENLMLSDDALALVDTDWPSMQQKIKTFVEESPHHPYHSAVKEFFEKGLDRKGADIKSIRNILIGFMTDKPWEVLVGQAIANVAKGQRCEGKDSLAAYLGPKACSLLLNLTP
jgi:energy-coupling factor transporter ATP-binding protein EcfA2